MPDSTSVAPSALSPSDDAAASAPSSRADGYARGRATKQQIVIAAADAFGQKGFHGASLRAIAREAGVDHSTLLHHFGNKTALLVAVLEWHDAQMLPAEMPEVITPQYVADAFVATAERNKAQPGIVQLLSVMVAEAGHEGHPARESMQGRHDMITWLMSMVIRQARVSGSVTGDPLSPEERAAVIVSMWDGMQIYDALHPGVLDVPAILRRELETAFGLQ